MNVSHEWLKAFVPHALAAEQVRDLLTAHAATVEGFERLRADLAPFVVARVVETQQVPDTKLSFNKVDDGSGTLLEVVCGAPNVTAGAVYPFARSGTMMPAGFKIEKKKIRGFTSNGMLCSARELGLGEDQAGILELTTDAAPGTPLLDVLPAGDVRLVVDVLPNRPDLLSHLGVARELSALTGVPIQNMFAAMLPVADEAARQRAALATSSALDARLLSDAREAASDGATVRLEDADGCPQYVGAVVRGITVAPSPAWLRERVEAAGVRSINNVVDVTNVILHGLGQPMHAFDLGTLAEQTVVIRRARAGEKMVTLDGVERALTPEMTMIADASRSIAVAGVMGGQNSEVTERTTDLLLEVAYFDPRRTRLTRRALGLSTDASYRFERGIDPQGLETAMRLAIALMLAVAGGRVDGGIMVAGVAPAALPPVTLRCSRVSRVLGAEVSAEQIMRYLTGVGFGVRGLGEGGRVEMEGGEGVMFSVTPPSWRRDVSGEVDLIEEVARLHGYDRLPDTIAAYRPTTVPDHPLHVSGRRVRDALVAAGLCEVRPMPFVNGDDASHWRVTNPLAEDEPHLRTSVLQSLGSRAEYNLTRMTGDIRIFEVGSVFLGKGTGTVEARGTGTVEARGTGTVEEQVRVGVLLMGGRHPRHFADGAVPVLDAWDAKGLAERTARAAFPGLRVGMVPATEPALWRITANERDIGLVTRVALDAPVWASPAFGIEITLGTMPLAYVAEPGHSAHAGVRPAIAPPAAPVRFAALPTTPAAEFDLALLVRDDLPAAEVERVLRASASDMLEQLELFDEFRGAGVPEGMRSLAWRLTFRHPERTLRDKEIDGRRSQLLKSLENQLGVKPRTA